MSYKTRELAKLFPDVYASDDADSLLYKLLEVIGAELMVADERIKQLLKTHWVNYASGQALDGLGAIYSVQRRLLPDNTLEPDVVFRPRLKSVVPLFTGGGTKKAVLGAVRSALGLPFDLDQLNLPARYDSLRRDLENLIILEEFSPKTERLVEDGVTEVGGTSELILVVDIPSVKESRPQIQWTFSDDGQRSGSGRKLSLELLGAQTESGAGVGVKSKDDLLVRPGESLILSAGTNGQLSAAIGTRDVSSLFTDLDDSEPATMLKVPLGRSEWRFRAQSGLFDISTFDDDTYDLPRYEVEMSWTRYEPLSFDVRVPYFLKDAVQQLKDRYHYDQGEIFAFQGLPQETIQEVVDQTRAAGVRGHVHFSLNWAEDHGQKESTRIEAKHRISENADATDSLDVGSFNREAEAHDLREVFVIGGVWDVATFDGSYGFQ